MPTEIRIEAEPALDPRGVFRRQSVALAARCANLSGKRVLLFDNSQHTSQLPAYGPIFKWLTAYLEDEHGAICLQRAENLLRLPRTGLTQLADEISRDHVDAVVVALCNAGITQPTSLFAAELEQRRIPCVQMCTALSCDLAAVTASNYVPGLPIVVAKPASGDSETFGRQETLGIAAEVVAGLTSDPATLIAAFHDRFGFDVMQPAKNRTIAMPAFMVPVDKRDDAAVATIDPGRHAEDLYGTLCNAHLCDGLPVIPPTARRVDAMLAYTDLDPDHALVEELPPSGAAITVRTLAVNAVMAGCRPECFPILVAAFQAIADPAYRAFQGAITTHPSGNAVVVGGPLAEEIGIHAGAGCLGPGFRANATIGRAVNLTIANVSRAIPGKSDLSTYGSPAEFTYCFAESIHETPWQPLNAELYDPETTSVTVHKCEGPHNVLDPRTGPAELLRAIADTATTLGGNNLLHPGELLVMLNPAQAQKLAAAGFSKRRVKEFLFEAAQHPVEVVRGQERATIPSHLLDLPRVPVMRSPDDVILVICGARGTMSMVGVPWGLAHAVSRPVVWKDGTPIKSLARST